MNKESQRLRELIREIGLPLRQLPEIILAKPEECLSWWSQLDSSIKVTETHFQRLAGLVGIEENQLFIGDYDKNLARKRVLGDYHSLPERYSENKNSFLRTSAHIIRYVALTRGQAFADRILTGLNVSPLIYQDTNLTINLTYFADLLDALSKNGFSQHELDTLASVIFLSLQETKLGQKFQTSKDFHDVYEVLACNFDYFDSNFEYKSEFIGKKYILRTVLPLAQHKLLRSNPENLQRLMRYRHILLAWFPYLSGLTPLFPKAELVRSSEVIEMRYEFNLAPKTRPPRAIEAL